MNELLLVVDDDPGVLNALSIRLRAARYDVRTARDGVAGLEAIRLNRPQVILLDLRMPRMDGFTLLSRLRESDETQSIPVIVLSANVVEQSRTRALELGARYFLEKPYDIQQLMDMIGAVLAVRTPAASGT